MRGTVTQLILGRDLTIPIPLRPFACGVRIPTCGRRARLARVLRGDFDSLQSGFCNGSLCSSAHRPSSGALHRARTSQPEAAARLMLVQTSGAPRPLTRPQARCWRKGCRVCPAPCQHREERTLCRKQPTPPNGGAGHPFQDKPCLVAQDGSEAVAGWQEDKPILGGPLAGHRGQPSRPSRDGSGMDEDDGHTGEAIPGYLALLH